MIKRLTDAISLALSERFPDSHIYTEEVEQGLELPAFLIVPELPTHEQFMDKRYFQRYPFKVHYFPEKEGFREEVAKVFSNLYDCLEWVKDLEGQPYTGRRMQSFETEHALVFEVTYSMFVDRITQDQKMESLENNLETE